MSVTLERGLGIKYGLRIKHIRTIRHKILTRYFKITINVDERLRYVKGSLNCDLPRQSSMGYKQVITAFIPTVNLMNRVTVETMKTLKLIIILFQVVHFLYAR